MFCYAFCWLARVACTTSTFNIIYINAALTGVLIPAESQCGNPLHCQPRCVVEVPRQKEPEDVARLLENEGIPKDRMHIFGDQDGSIVFAGMGPINRTSVKASFVCTAAGNTIECEAFILAGDFNLMCSLSLMTGSDTISHHKYFRELQRCRPIGRSL